MSDLTLNSYLASGDTAERTAFTPDPPTPASGPSGYSYLWWDTDLELMYAWDPVGLAWVQLNGSSSGAPVSQKWTIDGGGSPITDGVIRKYIYFRQAVTLIGWSLQADLAGDVEIDIFVDDPDVTYPPTTSIVGTTAPELSGIDFAKSANLTGWTVAIPADTCIGIEIIGAATIEELVVQLDFLVT